MRKREITGEVRRGGMLSRENLKLRILQCLEMHLKLPIVN